MGILNTLLSLSPSRKHCGCTEDVGGDTKYEVWVKDEEISVERLEVCDECAVSVEVEVDRASVEYVGDNFNQRETVGHRGTEGGAGWYFPCASYDEVLRLLVEMRLSDALHPDLSGN